MYSSAVRAKWKSEAKDTPTWRSISCRCPSSAARVVYTTSDRGCRGRGGGGAEWRGWAISQVCAGVYRAAEESALLQVGDALLEEELCSRVQLEVLQLQCPHGNPEQVLEQHAVSVHVWGVAREADKDGLSHKVPGWIARNGLG